MSGSRYRHGERAAACRHFKYALTCDDYDSLQTEAGGRCRICGWEPPANGRPLFIDHDYKIGQWAARGLLCNTCNTRVGKFETGASTATGAIVAYLANPWHVKAFGLVTAEAEPAGGTRTLVRVGRPRIWIKRDDRWYLEKARFSFCAPVLTWRQMNYRYGPHHMSVLRAKDQIPDLSGLSRVTVQKILKELES